MIAYKTRKQQMNAFIREYKAGGMSLQNLVKNAAMCGAAEERYRTLQLARHSYPALCNEIAAESLLKVLGYEGEVKQ